MPNDITTSRLGQDAGNTAKVKGPRNESSPCWAGQQQVKVGVFVVKEFGLKESGFFFRSLHKSYDGIPSTVNVMNAV